MGYLNMRVPNARTGVGRCYCHIVTVHDHPHDTRSFPVLITRLRSLVISSFRSPPLYPRRDAACI